MHFAKGDFSEKNIEIGHKNAINPYIFIKYLHL